MAKKRKQTSGSTPNKHRKHRKPSEPTPQPPVDEEHQDVEQVEEEMEVKEDAKFEENAGENGDDDSISNLLEPFAKEQLITLLSKAAESHADVVDSIRKMADVDPAHRKIFVHGLRADASTDTLRSPFEEYGEIEDCKLVTDKVSGKSKGYAFILFKTRAGAKNALKEPHKKIGGRMISCHLAAMGPGPGPSGKEDVGVSELTQRKIYVGNVGAALDPKEVTEFFAKYGEIEEGPMGLDKNTGKFKGFCLFVYKNVESAKKALEQPHKTFEGYVFHCQKAVDGPKKGRLHSTQNSGGSRVSGKGQGVSGVPINEGGGVVAPALDPVTSQGPGLGNKLLEAIEGVGSPSGAVGNGTSPGGPKRIKTKRIKNSGKGGKVGPSGPG